MISQINLTTGPVEISRQVMKALSEPAISHRSPEFLRLYRKTLDLLSSLFNVKETFVLTGSGTMANEAMLQEIKHSGDHGLILSNGEFGLRLMNQARRNNISFTEYKLEWGKLFDLVEIERLVKQHKAKWILFCHCETSTGIINDLGKLIELSASNNCHCFADCMSTVGTRLMDLSGVAMATASSGKGLASIPGLAIVFSNRKVFIKKDCPVYLDLAHYRESAGIPFTISSNLLKALYVSISQKLIGSQYDLLNEYSAKFYTTLSYFGLIPFAQKDTRVFTIISRNKNKQPCFHKLVSPQLVLSRESNYLKTRGWCQLAAFGFYSENQLKQVEQTLVSALH